MMLLYFSVSPPAKFVLCCPGVCATREYPVADLVILDMAWRARDMSVGARSAVQFCAEAVYGIPIRGGGSSVTSSSITNSLRYDGL